MSYVEIGALYEGLIVCCGGYAYFLLAAYALAHGPSVEGGPMWVQLGKRDARFARLS